MKVFFFLRVNNQDVGEFAVGCALFRPSEGWIVLGICAGESTCCLPGKLFHKRWECYLNVESFSLLEKREIVEDA